MKSTRSEPESMHEPSQLALKLKPTGKEAQLKKHVAVVHSSGSLSLVELKLYNILLLNSYDHLMTQRSHSIPTSLLMEMLGWRESNNVTLLKKSLKKLQTTAMEFNLLYDGQEDWESVALMSYARIYAGCCTYRFDEAMAEKLYQPSMFALIHVDTQDKFTSAYALRLYENCSRFKSTGSTGWIAVPVLRKLLGATQPYYDTFARLREKILNPAIAEINDVSNIRVVMEVTREFRVITKVRFIVFDTLQANDDQLDAHALSLIERLKAHGISQRLASQWVLINKDRVDQALQYVESQSVKKSTAGYLRTVIESDSELIPRVTNTPSPPPRQPDAGAPHATVRLVGQPGPGTPPARYAAPSSVIGERLDSLRKTYQQMRMNELLAQLSPQQYQAYALEYAQGAPGSKVDPSHPECFSDPFQLKLFKLWLRGIHSKKIAQSHNEDAFLQWVEESGKLST